MAKLNQLRTGVWLTYLNLLIGNIIPLIYTPYMLSVLGQDEYGLYSLATSVIGYLSLLNFGVGGSVVRYITKYRANNDKDGEERIIGLFTSINIVVASVMLICGTVLAFNVQLFYSNTLSSSEIETLRTLIILMTINVAFFFPISIFTTISIAHEKYILNKLINLIATILIPILNVLMLFLGFKSVGLIFATMIINFLSYSAYFIYNTKVLNIRPRFKNMPLNLLKEIYTFSFFIFLTSIVNLLYWSTDKILIGAQIGASAVAVYNIGSVFNNYITSFSTAISGVLMPRVTTMVTKNVETEKLSELFIRVGRMQFLIVSLVLSGFAIFGRQFIYLWAGPDYSESYIVALLVMVPVAIPLMQNTGLSILMAKNKHKYRAIVYLIIAVVNVTATYFLIDLFGIIGAAAATCIAYVIGPIILMNRYYYKVIKIDIPGFWKNIVRMSPVTIIFMIIGFTVTFFVDINNWQLFLASIIVYAVLFFVISFKFTMNDYEKDVFKKPILAVVNKIKKIKK